MHAELDGVQVGEPLAQRGPAPDQRFRSSSALNS